jgi:hypothetical protein
MESAQASELAPMLRPTRRTSNRNQPGHLLCPTVTSDVSSDWLLIDVQTRGTGADPEKVIFWTYGLSLSFRNSSGDSFVRLALISRSAQ